MACSSCGKARRRRGTKHKRFNIAKPSALPSPSAEQIRNLFRAQEEEKPAISPNDLILLKNRDAA
jgi:hypothetical protein